MTPPLLISLPGGLYVSGVVSWAVRLVNTLASRGARAGLILHRAGPHHAPLDIPLHAGVRRFDLSHLTPLTECDGRLDDYIAAYTRACIAMTHEPRPGDGRGAATGVPEGAGSQLILAPNLHGDDYGIAAAVSQRLPDLVRIVGWCHLDSAYDRAVLAHYGPCISRFIAVSTATTEALRSALPARGQELSHIPYGVPVADALPTRAPLLRRARAAVPSSSPRHLNPSTTLSRSCVHPRLSAASLRPPRLLYVGRIEEGIKRVSTLIAASDALLRRGVGHQLTLVGDGPAAAEVDKAFSTRPTIRRLPPVSPHETAAHYAAADFFLLPSRAEGLSLAMLEAMGQGCIPIVTDVRSGPSDAIDDGRSGLLIDDSDSVEILAERFAETLARLLGRATADTLSDMSAAAIDAARRFSIERHADLVSGVLNAAAASPPRPWPADRPCSFTRGGVVPPEGPARLRAALESLRGERVIIHGAGRHTQELLHVFGEYADRIIAFTDDNPLAHGARLMDRPVLAPPGPEHATAVLISSHIHQQDILAGSRIYGSRRIVTLYPAPAATIFARHCSSTSSTGHDAGPRSS